MSYLKIRGVVAGLSLLSFGFDLRLVNVGFVVNKMALGQVFLRILGFSPVGNMPPKLPIHYVKNIHRKDERANTGNLRTNQCTITVFRYYVNLVSRTPLPLAAEGCTGYTNVRAA